VADFDDGKLAARFGSWSSSTDQMRGGTSTVELHVVPGGAGGTKHALEITGEIRGAGPLSWAGAMHSPGASMMAPANLSAKKELVFWVKGDGHTHRVMLFAKQLGMAPAVRKFVASREWTEVVLPIDSFDGVDGRDVLGVLWTAGREPGKFAFRIDRVSWR
jgi:hypothetical protein